MKKSNLIKAFSILILSIVVISICTMVNAADANGYNDLSATLTGNAAGGNNTNTNNANVNGVNTNANKANTNNTNKANNASVYNNTNLPKTGIESSLPVAALVVVFGISAVYAYKKIKDYRNI